jgi:hypothetical protein
LDNSANAEQFLREYRRLEGLLEKRYVGRKLSSSSVVMEYLRDPDSEPCRPELDLCREIRNLLTHNPETGGEPVVIPSAAVLDAMHGILEHVQRPRLAVDYGTPGDRILFAHPNDSALDVMRHMMRMGYSHVPVRDRTGLVGVFSPGALMSFVSDKGFENLRDDLRVGDLKNALSVDNERNDKYLFFDSSVTLTTVRMAFEKRQERNRRLAVVFITEDGGQHSQVLAMLAPWDALKDRN